MAVRRLVSGVGMSYRGPGPRLQRAPYRARRISRRDLRWVLPVGTAVVIALLTVAATAPARGRPVESASSNDVTAPARRAARPARELLAPRGPAPRVDQSRAAPLPVVPARAYILVDEASGAVLAESGATRRLAPASVTKIATAVLLLELGHLDGVATVDIDFNDLEPDSTVMGLAPGDRYTFRDLLYGLMLRSGNDAAIAIARAVSGDETRFVNTMNALAARLELADTHFTDPHGLGGPEHYTSAHDLAALTRYAFTIPGFAEVVRETRWDAHGSKQIELWNSNVFLYAYDGADGVKIGYTEEADRTLVASATRNGHRLIAVVLGDSYAATHASNLLDWGWESACWPTTAGGCERVTPGD